MLARAVGCVVGADQAAVAKQAVAKQAVAAQAVFVEHGAYARVVGIDQGFVDGLGHPIGRPGRVD